MFGYHTPIVKKSFQKSIQRAHQESGIRAFQIFVRNPRQLREVVYDEVEAEKCKKYIEENHFFLVSHGTYLLNSATTDDFEKKVASALNELFYAEKVGAIGSVFHVGKHVKQGEVIGVQNMYHFISTVLQELQNAHSSAYYILETSASAGTELLSNIESLGQFFHSFSEQHRKNLRICIDTCHVFAAGYDLRTEEKCNEFIVLVSNHIGWENVALIHLNDSKKDCGCKVDRHENLKRGFIAKDDDSGLQRLVCFCREQQIPFILETPHNDDDIFEIYGEEIRTIESWLK